MTFEVDTRDVVLETQVLLDLYRTQMMAAIGRFKSADYHQSVQRQIDDERRRQETLTSRAAQLEKQVRPVRQRSHKSVRFLIKLRLAPSNKTAGMIESQ